MATLLSLRIPPAGEALRKPFATGVAAMLTELHSRIPFGYNDPVSWLRAAVRAPAYLDASAVPDFIAASFMRLHREPPPAPGTASAGTPAPSAQPAMPVAAGMIWSPDRIIRLLQQIPGVAAELDLGELRRRLIIAGTMAAAAEAVPMIEKSEAKIGDQVHRALQTRYRSQRPFNNVVIERKVWGPSFNGTPLSDAAAVHNGHFVALDLALAAPFTEKGKLRTDLTDFTRAELWDIKPIASAPGGVVQETYYRVMFNMTAQTIAPGPLMVRRLADGLLWEPDLMGPVEVSNDPQLGVPRIALPLPLLEVPGVLIYVVMRSPMREDFEVLRALILAYLFDRMRRLIDETRRRGGGLMPSPAEVRSMADAFLGSLYKWGLVAAAIVLALALRTVQFSTGGFLVIDPSTLPPELRRRNQPGGSFGDPRGLDSLAAVAPGYGVRMGDLPLFLNVIGELGSTSFAAALDALGREARASGARAPVSVA
jgi:hypothetical protein